MNGWIEPGLEIYQEAVATKVWSGTRTGNPGKTVGLRGRLTLADNTPLPGREVEFFVNNELVGTATTAADGFADFTYAIPSDMASGVYSIEVGYPGTVTHQPQIGRSNLTVVYHATTLWTGNRTGTVGGLVTLNAILRDAVEDVPATGQLIQFSVNGTPLGSGITLADGSVAVTVTIPDTIGSGVLPLTASFAGSDGLAPSTRVATLTVNKANVKTWTGNRSGAVGTTVNLAGLLTRASDDAPIGGQPVSFLVNGVPVASPATLADGTASFGPYLLSEVLGAGTHTLTFSFAGNGAYNAGSANATLTVLKADANLQVSNRAGKAGAPVTLRVRLRRSTDFANLGGRTVTLSVPGHGFGSVTTLADGFGNLATTVPALPPGNYVLTASFAGDASHNAGIGTATLTVQP